MAADSFQPDPLLRISRSPTPLRRRLDQLVGLRSNILYEHDQKTLQLQSLASYLTLADSIEGALDILSQQLFGDIVSLIEGNLTIALQEVLEQPIVLKVDREFKRGSATMNFHIHRNGQREDILRGQGGSVANILSVGLRIFALTTLDKTQHRRFLVLDEQDCWLRPDLVPHLVRIVHDAARTLGFQVLMISHHDIPAFERYAAKIYRFTPTPDGVSVKPLYQLSTTNSQLSSTSPP